jgi:hypothetical protein
METGLLVIKVHETAGRVRISFEEGENGRKRYFSRQVETLTFGRAQHNWDPAEESSRPRWPASGSQADSRSEYRLELPAASAVVLTVISAAGSQNRRVPLLRQGKDLP